MQNRLVGLGFEVWAGIFLLVFSVAYWLEADGLQHSVLGGSVGADGMPKLLGVALGFMACLLIAQSLMASAASRGARQADLPNRTELLRAIGMWAIGACFVAVMPWIGYPASVFGALIAIGMYYGRRFSPLLVAFAVGGSIVFYLLFDLLLDVPMPMGAWFDLINN